MVAHSRKGQAVGKVARVEPDELVKIFPKLNARPVADAEDSYDLIETQ